jgi:hypothetical protein
VSGVAALGTLRAKVASTSEVQTTMLIRSTAHACYVELPNGLTLELCYDIHSAGSKSAAAAAEGGERRSRGVSRASQGVWVFQEEVVLEVKVGQA